MEYLSACDSPYEEAGRAELNHMHSILSTSYNLLLSKQKPVTLYSKICK
jgi:hypothetical protein